MPSSPSSADRGRLSQPGGGALLRPGFLVRWRAVEKPHREKSSPASRAPVRRHPGGSLRGAQAVPVDAQSRNFLHRNASTFRAIHVIEKRNWHAPRPKSLIAYHAPPCPYSQQAQRGIAQPAPARAPAAHALAFWTSHSAILRPAARNAKARPSIPAPSVHGSVIE